MEHFKSGWWATHPLNGGPFLKLHDQRRRPWICRLRRWLPSRWPCSPITQSTERADWHPISFPSCDIRCQASRSAICVPVAIPRAAGSWASEQRTRREIVRQIHSYRYSASAKPTFATPARADTPGRGAWLHHQGTAPASEIATEPLATRRDWNLREVRRSALQVCAV
jgi:hypothetical protein